MEKKVSQKKARDRTKNIEYEDRQSVIINHWGGGKKKTREKVGNKEYSDF